jgi:phosphate transport system protein
VGLDERAAEIDEDAAQILAYRQPLAQGLREAIAAIRIAPTLERIGDLSKNIARRAEALSSFAPKQIELSVTRLGQSVKVHLSQSLDAFSSRDSELAMRLREKDAEIDEQFNALFRDLMYEMSQNSRSIGLGVHLMFISKNLERIGDHSTFISELTYYVSVGQAPKVERQKGRPNAQKLV